MNDHADMGDFADTMHFHFKNILMKFSIRLKLWCQGQTTKKRPRNKNVFSLLTKSEKKRSGIIGGFLLQWILTDSLTDICSIYS